MAISEERLEKLRSYDPSTVIVFDTETTGKSPMRDEILSLAIIDLNGNVLFNDMFKPVDRIRWPKAESIHGISPAMVAGKPSISEHRSEIEGIFKSASLIVGYNLEFDLDFLEAAEIKVPKKSKFDVMKEFAKIHGEYNPKFGDYKWMKLSVCAGWYDYRDLNVHDALGDVKATAYCFKELLNDRCISERRPRPKVREDEYGDSYIDYGDWEDEVIHSDEEEAFTRYATDPEFVLPSLSQPLKRDFLNEGREIQKTEDKDDGTLANQEDGDEEDDAENEGSLATAIILVALTLFVIVMSIFLLVITL